MKTLHIMSALLSTATPPNKWMFICFTMSQWSNKKSYHGWYQVIDEFQLFAYRGSGKVCWKLSGWYDFIYSIMNHRRQQKESSKVINNLKNNSDMVLGIALVIVYVARSWSTFNLLQYILPSFENDFYFYISVLLYLQGLSSWHDLIGSKTLYMNIHC